MQHNFNQVIQEYGALLGRVAASYEANLHLRQELLQEITLAVWQALPSFKQQSSLKTYILKVAHNRAISHVAYQVKHAKNQSYDDDAAQSLVPEVSAEQQLQLRQQVERLLIAVRRLPIQTRQIVTLSMEGLSYEDIAQVCGIQPGNVGAILSRTKKILMEAVSYVR